MKKYTKRFKKNKNNRTIKKGGSIEKKREGIIDIVGNKISDVTSYVRDKITDNSLKFIGLERIKDTPPQEVSTQKFDESSMKKLSDAASGVVSGVENILDKTGANILGATNDILGSDTAKDITKEAAKETADIIKESVETFNETLNEPEVKEEVKKAIKNAGEIGEVVAKAAEEPLKKVVKVGVEASTSAFGAASSGAIKVGTDMLGAIPGVGGIIEIGKMINDSSKAASAIVEAGTEAVEASSDAFINTTKNVKEELKELEEKKKMSQEIFNRTDESIKEFENPKIIQQQGGCLKKTKRKLNNTRKTKKVRFTI
jgi:hypothetical protein